MNTTIRSYAMVVLLYAIAVLIVQWLGGASPLTVLASIVASLPSSVVLFFLIAWKGIIPVVIVFGLFRRHLTVARIRFAISIFVVHAVLFLFFFAFKTSMPALSSFWADPLMADIDHFLHRGDPYRITAVVLQAVPANVFKLIYSDAWFLPTFYLPIWIALLDPNEDRVRRVIMLHTFVWIAIGSILAFAFLSAGPVFYDRLLDSTRFVGLTEHLATSGIQASAVGFTQNDLWSKYIAGLNTAGSGISAFPSVHVGMATVVAVYLYELSRRFAALSIAFVVVYQALSVHLGWHYAVDGYVSIILVVLMWMALRARSRTPKR